MSPPDPVSFFVYGTLRQGNVRAHVWPHPPRRIVRAHIRAQLYDLGAYPAILPGNDWVAGERWEFPMDQIDDTLAILDAVECVAEGLYRRDVVTCHDGDGTTHRAFSYFFAQQQALPASRRVPRDPAGTCQWRPVRPQD